MRERVTKIFSCLFIASSLLVTLFPFFIYVKADNPTYIDYSSGYCQLEWGSRYFNANTTGRLVRLFYNATDFYIYFIQDPTLQTAFYYKDANDSSCSLSLSSAHRVGRVGNDYYWYAEIGPYSDNNLNSPIPAVYLNRAQTLSDAVYYTYGAGAVGPEEEIVWGGPANVMYNTRISGTGQMASQNIDRIVFSPDIDSNGNILPDNARFQIRAVPLEYSGLTPTDVLSKTYSQAILDYTDATVLMDRIPANGVYEIKWSEVAEILSIPFATVNSVIQGDDYFYKMGWIYEIRLQIDDYYSEWQKIYTATSSGAQVEEDISNTDTISQDLIKNITIINTLNNTETVNWYLNETEINMQEYNEPGQGDKPWWAYLLEAIVNSFNITNNYINDGNDTTINISNTVNNSDDEMNNKINQYQQYEDDFIQDMDDNLTDIDVDVPLLSNSKFVNSAQWVAQQYTRMTNNTVIGSLLGFSLVFGLALIFIGRIR